MTVRAISETRTATEQELVTRGMAQAADLLTANGMHQAAQIVIVEVAKRIRER